MPASCYLTAIVDNCIPRQQLGSCSMTRPFLSLRRVWLVRLHDSLIALYVNLNEAVAQLVRITQGYTFISSVSYVCLPQQYVAHFHITPDGAFMKHTRLMSDGLSSKTRTASQGEILYQSHLQSPFSLPKKYRNNRIYSCSKW